MNILNGTDDLLRNLNTNQRNLQTLTSRLASGLRVQSAADDPSGLAISESLRSRVGGLQQAVENVQTGGNLLTVADGAAATIQSILQRIDSLIVESNSDINSDQQLSAIQAEIESMLTEVNHISSSANFNGLKLFDGSHDTYVANPYGQQITVQIVNAGAAANGDVATPNVANSQLPSPNLIQNILQAGGQIVPGLFVFKTESYDPTTQTFTLEADLYSTSNAFSSNGNESIQTNSGIALNAGPQTGLNYALPSGYGITLDLANVTAADVGTVAEGVYISKNRASGGGTAISVNDSGTEGGTVAISLPTLNTNALGISDISVLRPTQVDPFNNTTGVDSSNQWAAMNAQISVENALNSISSLRAQLGAEMVSTQQDSNNDNIAIANLTSSESSIRDLSVGSTVTEFTKDQILNQVGMSVLSQYEVDARQLSALMIQALVA